MKYDAEILEKLLEEAGLKVFFGYATELMNAWIKGTPMSQTALNLQSYVLSGGAYGSYDNYIKASISDNVVKYPYLLNWYRICRLCRALINGKTKRGIKELKSSIKTSEDNTVGNLIEELKLR